MTNEQFDDVTEALAKIGTLQVQMITKIVRLQAQVAVQERLIQTVLQQQGVEAESLGRHVDGLWKHYDARLLNALKDWLAANDIATPVADDPWWDKPSST